jgi:hypothetical protein
VVWTEKIQIDLDKIPGINGLRFGGLRQPRQNIGNKRLAAKICRAKDLGSPAIAKGAEIKGSDRKMLYLR